MNFEQACRFATSDSGYRIFAQSEGFSEQSAGGMTSIFNDVMNPVFGKVGQSMITMNISSNDVFFARLTLRSDIKSRKSMFTNAAVIPIDFYSRMMLDDPGWMLQFPYKDLLSQRPGNERMDPVKMVEYETDKDVSLKICSEYDLDGAALTEFVMKLYRAEMEGTSLCLTTILDSSRTPDLAVKYAVLAATLLPPSLRNVFSFSSMGDARCTLCVQPGDGGELLAMGKDILRFQADKKNRIVLNNEKRPVDMQGGMADMFVNFANLLSEKLLEDREELEKILRRLDENADRIAGTRRGFFSFELLMISYYLTEGKELSLIEAVYLINALIQYSQGNPTNDKAVNELLAEWVYMLSSAGVCANINIAAPLTVRAIEQEDELLYDAVVQMLKHASDGTRTDLAQIILQKEYSGWQKHLVNELLIENPAAWSDELLENLFAWSCRNNIKDLASVIWTRKNSQINSRKDNKSETAELLHRLLRDNSKEWQHKPKEKALFNECEMFYMANGLAEMCDYVDSRLPEEALSENEVNFMCANYSSFSALLRENWISYLLIFRYCAGKPLDKQIRSLKEMKISAPEVFEDVCAALKSDNEEGQNLLEAYWTDTLIENCSSLNALSDVCNKYNITQNPKGIMETQVRKKWITLTSFYSGAPLQNEMASLMRHYEILDGTKMSDMSQQNLKDEITLRFWKCVNLKTLLDNALNGESINYLQRCMRKLEHQPHEEISAKMTAFYYTADAFFNPGNMANHAFFRYVVEDEEWSCKSASKDFSVFRPKMHKGDIHFSASDIDIIQRAVLKVAGHHMKYSGVCYIDYLLFAVYFRDEKYPDEEGYDFDEFRNLLNRLIREGLLQDNTQLRLEDSMILYGDDAELSFRKDIRKVITKNDPQVLREFAEQLREQKTGFLGLFGRKKYDENDDQKDEKKADASKAKKKRLSRMN